ncbi:MAG TPA: IS21-like element helper ATPase IstB [Bacteroidia bacterium]|nr:IS21-like element helper ATPase IstB [Bacteroidia bacterium]
MDKKKQVKEYCKQFRTTGISENFEKLIEDAESNQTGFLDFTLGLLKTEADLRCQSELARRVKVAKLPRYCDLGIYDYTSGNGIQKVRLNQLRELNWVDQIYNIMLMGPSGTGKTFLAAGLCSDAVEKGYKAYFRTMEELSNMLKLKDFTRSAMAEYKRLTQANLIVIDDIMLFPVEKKQAVALFAFINQIYENTSFIITTNKMPAEWAKMLDDEVLATALLDRFLYKCEIINLTGKSYRMKNRKSIFEPKNN